MRLGYFLFLVPPILFVIWATMLRLRGLSRLKQLLFLMFIVLFSYPFLFTFDRGNLEFYLMISLGVFFLFYESQDSGLRNLACCGLACAIALKIYPVLLLLLLIKDRRVIDCLKVLLICEVLTVGAACMFVGGAQTAMIDFKGMLTETDQLVKDQLAYAHGNAGIFYGVVVILKTLCYDTALSWFYAHYWILAAALLLVYSVLILRSDLALWESALCVTSLMCLLPSLSNDYRTLQLLIPIMLFITAATR